MRRKGRREKRGMNRGKTGEEGEGRWRGEEGRGARGRGEGGG